MDNLQCEFGCGISTIASLMLNNESLQKKVNALEMKDYREYICPCLAGYFDEVRCSLDEKEMYASRGVDGIFDDDFLHTK